MRFSAKLTWTRAFLLLPLLLAAPGAATAQSEGPERALAEMPVPTIRVAGEGEASLAPDTAILRLGVVREARSAREALDANNQAMGRVIAAMKEEGVESRDLQTSGFSISPRYSRPEKHSGRDSEPRIIGYSVSNRLTVRVRNLDELGKILDKSVTLGVNSDGNISFTNDDPSQAIDEARAQAMRDAKARAETLAEAAGVELGQLLEVSESFNRPFPKGIERSARMAMAADSVPVEAGENSYSVTVQASWMIKQ